MQPHALALGGDRAAFLERLLEQLEVGLLEERVGWADRVGRVRDDDIKRVLHPRQFASARTPTRETRTHLLVLEELEAVANVHGDALVVETCCHVREELLRDTRDGLVNVAQDGLLDGRVLEHLAQDAAVAAANHEHVDWVRVRRKRQVRNHLLVADEDRGGVSAPLGRKPGWMDGPELVALHALDRAVEHEHVAMVGRLKDEHVLVQALLGVEDLLNLERHGLAFDVARTAAAAAAAVAWVALQPDVEL